MNSGLHRSLLAGLGGALFLGLSCKPAEPSSTQAEAEAASSPAVSPAQPTPRDEREPTGARTEDLEVPGFEPAVLYVPAGEQALPLVVANHGAGGRAEWECDYWRGLIEQPALFLCLRGTETSSGSGSYFYRTHLELEKELKAALSAVRSRLGARIREGGGLYAGFSQGATMGAAMIAPYGGTFEQLALVEGGYDNWSPQTAQRFAEGGGKRVLFGCGTQTCVNGVKKPTEWLTRASVQVKTVFAPAGHTPGGAVQDAVQDALPWLLENW